MNRLNGYFAVLIIALAATLPGVALSAPSEGVLVGLSDYERYRVYPFVERGYRALEQDNLPRAMEAFERAHRRAPEHTPLTTQLAVVYLRAGEEARALEILARLGETPGMADGLLLQMIEDGQLRPAQVETWLPRSNRPGDLKRAMAERLATDQDDEAALGWLNGLECTQGCDTRLRLMAIYAERDGRPEQVIEALQALASESEEPLSPTETQRLAFALAGVGRYAEAADVLADSPGAESLARELRRTGVISEGLSEEDFDRLMADTDEPDMLLRMRVLTLAGRDGDQAALDWLEDRPCERACGEQRRLSSIQAQRIGQSDTVVASLEALREAQDGTLAAEDLDRLVRARIARGEYAEALAATADIDDEDALAEELLRQITQSAVAAGRDDIALEALDALDARTSLSAEERQQWITLAERSGDSDLALAVAGQVGLSCASQAELALRVNRQTQARQLFETCPSGENPLVWLWVGERLHAYDTIRSASFDGRQASQRRVDILANHYGRTGNWGAVLDLLEGSVTTHLQREQLAQAYAETGDHGKAAETWHRLYRDTGDLDALGQATFHAVRGEDPEQAKAWILAALPLPRTVTADEIRERFLTLVSEDPEQVDAETLEMLAANAAAPQTLAATAWVYQLRGDCDRSESLLEGLDELPRAWLIRAECAEDTGTRVAYRDRARELGAVDQERQLAYDYAAAGDPQSAVAAWQEVSEDRLGEDDRLAWARSALASDQAQLAEEQWSSIETSQHDGEAWALGAEIAEARLDLDEAGERWHKALAADPQARYAYHLGQVKRDQDRPQEAREYLELAVEMEPDNPLFQAELGFALIETDPVAARDALEAAHRLGVDDATIHFQLGFLHQREGNREQSLASMKRGITVLEGERPNNDPDALRDWKARHYGARRAHQQLQDRWRYNLAGFVSTARFVGDPLTEGQPRRNLLMGEAERFFLPGRWSAFARLSADGTSADPLDSQILTGGMAWRPGWGDTRLSAEATYGDLSTDPETGLLLRAGRTWLADGEWRAGWRPCTSGWWEQSLGTSAAYWVRQDDNLPFLWSRYELRRHWKIGGESAQSVFAYPLAEAQWVDGDSDLRVGAGVGWQVWTKEDRFNAHRHRYEFRLEVHQTLSGDLADDDLGVFLRWNWGFR